MNTLAPTRRTLVKGAAWSLPVLAAASAVPALAVSCHPVESQWYLKSRIVYTDPDYSNVNFDNEATYESTPPGEASIQHFITGNGTNMRVNWRIALGFPQGLEDGAVVTIPLDPSWTDPSKPDHYSLALFKQFGALRPDNYTNELPAATVDTVGNSFVITFHGRVEAGSAGGFRFNATPVGGAAAVRRGDTFTCQATVTFTPVTCDAPGA